MPCPNISISPSECAESLSGISSTVYIGPIQPDGSLPKKEDMIAMEIPDDYTLAPLTEEDEGKHENMVWDRKSYTLSFDVTVSPEDAEKERVLSNIFFGTGGLTHRRIVRERKKYNLLRRNLKNPLRRHIPLYKESLHKAMLGSFPLMVERAKMIEFDKFVATVRQNFLYKDEEDH